LLHPRWYDDGARDLTGRFACLADRSTFRARLATIELDALMPALALALAPLPIGGYPLGLLLRLPELAERPDPAAPPAQPCAVPDALPVDARLGLVALLARSGRADLIEPRLGERLERGIRAAWNPGHPWFQPEPLERLARVAPRRALQLLRDLLPRRTHD